MSLLEQARTECVIFDTERKNDGEGGHETSRYEGKKFMAAITFDSSMEARRAEGQGVKSLYTVTTEREVVLKFHDTFKRLSDGKTFRVTSDGEDKCTPASAMLNMRQVTAEEYELPAGGKT